LISREEYFPFGETAFGSHAKKRYRYCGKERDEESGLYYYGARYYAPWSCRFVSIDPLAGAYAAWSPYSYALDNPVMMNDPSGMAPEGGGGNKDGSPFGKDSTTGETFLKRELDGVTISATRLLKNATSATPNPNASSPMGPQNALVPYNYGPTLEPPTYNPPPVEKIPFEKKSFKPRPAPIAGKSFWGGAGGFLLRGGLLLGFLLIPTPTGSNDRPPNNYPGYNPGEDPFCYNEPEQETKPKPEPPKVPVVVEKPKPSQKPPIRIALGIKEHLFEFAKCKHAIPYTKWEQSGLIPEYLQNFVSQSDINNDPQAFDMILEILIANPRVEFYFNRSLANGQLITNEMANSPAYRNKITMQEYRRMNSVIPANRVHYFERKSYKTYVPSERK